MRRAFVCWFAGLSGSGKTTVGASSTESLREGGFRALLLDGDDLRSRYHGPLGFEAEDIRQSNRFAAELCEKERPHHDVIFVALVSPFAASREAARSQLGPEFAEVFFAADLAAVMARDPKGLYARASQGELQNLVGYSSGYPFEPPMNPDLTLDSRRETPDESIARLCGFVTGRLARTARVSPAPVSQS